MCQIFATVMQSKGQEQSNRMHSLDQTECERHVLGQSERRRADNHLKYKYIFTNLYTIIDDYTCGDVL